MDFEEKVRKLRPLIGERRSKALWMEYSIYPEHRRELEGIVNALYEKHIGERALNGEIYLLPPSEDKARGEYSLGMVQYGDKPHYPFGLKEDDWIQHVGIFGRTGSGKTNVGFLIIKELKEKAKPFLIFDWKRNYRDLTESPLHKDLIIFTVGRDVSPFHFNPLIPPKGTLPTVWLKKLIEIMCHAYYLGEGVTYLLQKAIDSVFQEKKTYEGSGNYPTLLDVKRWLENYKARGREAQWMDSTLRVIGTLCYGEISRALNSGKPMSMEDVLNKDVVFELDSLTNSDKIFFIESLILWIHHYRLQEETREKFKHAIIIEEAHHVLLRKKQSKESVMDVLLREIREIGESIILMDQHPSLISIPSMGNTNCTIAMNLKHRLDVNAISSAMLLEESEQEYLGLLEVGSGIVRLQNRLARPFLVKFPQFEVNKGTVTDEKVRSIMLGHSANSDDLSPDEEPKRDIRPIRNEDKTGEELHRITEDQRRLLMDVIENPVSGIAERYKRLSFSVYMGNRIRDSLISKDLLNSYSIRTFEGRVNYLDLTEEGEIILREMGHEVERKRKGGPEHEYWKYRIAEHFRRNGCGIEIESPIGEGKTIDIVASKDRVRVAIEIETGKSDVLMNISKLHGYDFSEVWVVCLNDDISRLLRNRSDELDVEDKSRLRALTPKEILQAITQ
jgi:hypothetical protein